MKDTCSQGHTLRWKCFQSKGKVCRKCEDEKRKHEEKERRNHELELDREAKQRAYSAQLMELQDEIAHERRILREFADQQTREQVLAQHRKQLADLKTRDIRNTQNSPPPVPEVDVIVEPSILKPTPPIQAAKPADNEPAQNETAAPPQGKDPEPAKSSAMEDWEYQKKFENASLEPLDKLMGLVGLEEIKQQFLTIKSKVDTVVRQNANLKDERFGAAFLGNPGTGQSFCHSYLVGVHNLTASSRQNHSRSPVRGLLIFGGVLPGSHFVETSGSRLASEGVNGAKKHIEKILEEGGGTFFIDEAYQLVSNNFGGSQVLDFLLAEMENLTGKVVFIIAGYNKQMEDFFAHNPGIPSRIPYQLQFQDYEDS
jgi:hypothetical protein